MTDGRVFFERHYSEEELATRLLRKPWQVATKEFARQVDPVPQRKFYARAPWSYLYGGALRWSCAANFETGASTAILREGEQGVVYLKLRKPR